MYIYEAIQSTSYERPMITRKAWIYPTRDPGPEIGILPTDSPNGCMIICSEKCMKEYQMWTPQKGDLLADDWYPVFIIAYAPNKHL